MQKKPNLCFVGSLLGKNAGHITTQGEIMADLFAAEGYEVARVSSKLNRAARLAEIIAALIKNHRRFDLVLLEVYSGLSLIIADSASLLCKFFKLPLIMVLHGGNLPEYVKKHPLWTKRVLRRADCLIAPSEFLAQKIGAEGFEIKVVPNIIELESYTFRLRSSLSPRLIWMRSFHPIYNPQMAIRVFAELRKDYPAATLTMAGADKGLELEIKEMARKMNLADAVSFPGFLDREQKSREFSAADIYLNTNRIDNMPVSVLEACACGLPVVSTNVGGMPFLISDGENGLLVENENVAAMVEAIKRLLTDSGTAQKICRNAGLVAEKSSWTTLRKSWEKLFAAVLARASEKSPSRFSAKKLTIEK